MTEIPDSVWNIKWLYRLNLISKIYEEVKHRPRYIISEIVHGEENGSVKIKQDNTGR